MGLENHGVSALVNIPLGLEIVKPSAPLSSLLLITCELFEVRTCV